MSKIKIALDAGHGLHTAGKRCLKSIDSKETREWSLNNRIAVDVEDLLLGTGKYEVIRVDDRTGQTDVSLAARVKKANDWGADFYLSIHHDFGVSENGVAGTGGGTTVFVNSSCQKKSIEAQEIIYKNAVKYAGLKGNRADGTRAATLYVLKNTKMPANLIECGFMDSSTDIKYILDPAWSKKMAKGLAVGICEIYGGTIGETVAPATTSTPAQSTTSTQAFKNGDRVTLSSKATNYQGASKGVAIPSKYKGKAYTVSKVSSDGKTLLLKELESWVLASECSKGSSTTTTAPKPAGNGSMYFKACSQNEHSLVDGLNEIKEDASFNTRRKIAKANGILYYKGTAAQNNKLLRLLKLGKLKKA